MDGLGAQGEGERKGAVAAQTGAGALWCMEAPLARWKQVEARIACGGGDPELGLDQHCQRYGETLVQISDSVRGGSVQFCHLYLPHSA